MNYKAHIIFGFIISLIVGFILYYFKIYYPIITLSYIITIPIIVFIYSQLPDIDHRESIIRWIVTSFTLIFSVYILGRYFYQYLMNLSPKIFDIFIILILLIILSLIWILPKISPNLFGHRKKFHTILFGILLSLPLLYFNYIYFIVAFISYLSHLILDLHLKLV